MKKSILCGVSAAFGFCMAASMETELLDRPLPVRMIETTKTILASDFGAKPDTGENMLPALRQAVAEVSRCKKPVLLKLEPGIYFLDAEEVRTHALNFVDLSDVVLDGNGAEFIVKNPRMGGIMIDRSKRIIIKNISVDYDPLPYAQGWVTAVNSDKSFDIRLTDNSPEMDQPYFKQALRKWGALYDRDNPILAKTGENNWIEFKSWEKTGERKYRICGIKGAPEVGDAYVQLARENACRAVMMRDSEDITLEKLTVYASPSAPFVGRSCSNVGLFNCKVLIKPGRWIGANADAAHFPNNRIGPWIENCQFDGICDDAVNIYSYRNWVTGQPGPGTLTIKEDGFPLTEAVLGSTAWVFNPETGARVAEATVKSFERRGNVITVELDQEVPKLNLTPANESNHPMIFFSCYLGEKFVFRNNLVRFARRYGIVVPTQRGIIEGNTFDRCAASAISVSNHQRARKEIDMFTGGNLIIRGNTIENCEQQTQVNVMNTFGAISLSVLRTDHSPAEWRALNNVQIENNIIKNFRTAGIRLLNGGPHVTIRGNTIVSDGSVPLTPGVTHAGILIENSDPVRMENNRITDERNIQEIVVH
jgi:hypothetical protein